MLRLAGTSGAMSADRIVVLEQGRVAAAGTPAQTVTEEILARVFKCRRATGGRRRARRRLRGADLDVGARRILDGGEPGGSGLACRNMPAAVPPDPFRPVGPP